MHKTKLRLIEKLEVHWDGTCSLSNNSTDIELEEYEIDDILKYLRKNEERFVKALSKLSTELLNVHTDVYNKAQAILRIFRLLNYLYSKCFFLKITPAELDALSIIHNNETTREQLIQQLLEKNKITKQRTQQFQFTKKLQKKGFIKKVNRKKNPKGRGRPSHYLKLNYHYLDELFQENFKGCLTVHQLSTSNENGLAIRIPKKIDITY